MKIQIERRNDDYLLEATGASGIPVMMDNKSADEVAGSSPMELLLMAVGGCSAIDIIYILKKQRQEIKSYKVEVTGERGDQAGAKPFESIDCHVRLEGEIDPQKAKKAAALSFEKYCSVTITLDQSVNVVYKVSLNGTLL